MKGVKQELKKNTKNIRVYVHEKSNPSIEHAIQSVFGSRPDDHPDKNYITHEMYQHCMNLIRQAGRAKGNTMINKVV